MDHEFLDQTNGIHKPFSWEYTTQAARLAATGFISTDVGKLAWQKNGTGTDGVNTIWQLVATTPTWLQVATGASVVSNSSSLANGKIWIGDGSGVAQEKTLSGDLTTTNTGAVTVKRPLGFLITGALTTSSTIADIILPYSMTLALVKTGVGTAPATSDLYVDITYHATAPGSKTTIFTAGPGTNRPKIAVAGVASTAGVPEVTSLSQYGHIGITVAGTFTAATDLSIWLIPA